MSDKTGLVCRSIRERIRTGVYARDAAIPSERKLMAEFGVSRTTVRRAIDALCAINLLATRAGSGTFVQAGVPATEAGPAGASWRALILIVPTFSDPFYGEMIEGVEQEARRHGLRVLATQSDYGVQDESRLLVAADPGVHGAIVVPSTVETPSPGALAFVASGRPLVYLGRWPAGVLADSVRTDYGQAAASAVRHLLERGHRRIAYVEGRPYLPNFTPFDGYRAALRDAGLPVHSELACISDLPSEEAGISAVTTMVAGAVPFTAVLARNDVTAMGILRGLRHAGLRVPDDVALASIDDSLLARSADPPLTSVNPFSGMLGRMAVRLLQDRIDGTHHGPALHLMIGTALVARRSTEPHVRPHGLARNPATT